jgi:hypothetical protein
MVHVPGCRGQIAVPHEIAMTCPHCQQQRLYGGPRNTGKLEVSILFRLEMSGIMNRKWIPPRDNDTIKW